MSHRSNVVVIAGTGITAQGMDVVVAALKKSHCIEGLDVASMFWMYAYIFMFEWCVLCQYRICMYCI